MKKIWISVLAIIVAVSFVGCGKDNDNNSSAAQQNSSAVVSEPSSASQNEAEPETSSAEEQKIPVDASNISENLFENQFSLSGEVFQMPFITNELEAVGFSLSSNKANETLETQMFTSSILEAAAGEKLFVGIYNIQADTIPLGETKVSSITFKKSSLNNIPVVFAKGITIGSTMDEVKAAYGEPTKFNEGDASAKILRESLKYENPDNFANYYEFSFEDKILVNIDIRTPQV